MKKALIAFVVVIGLGFAFGGISVDIERSTIEAQESLPEGVRKFTDGAVNCYVLDKFKVGTAVHYIGGISCVKP
jgi:hypothetical protein